MRVGYRTIGRGEGDVYMRRWEIETRRRGSVKLHHIIQPDHDRHLHNHPWDFTSIILRGWYVEECPGYQQLRRPGSIAHRRAADLHRIRSVSQGGVWTLVFTGPRVQVWGFDVDGDIIPWDEYLDETDVESAKSYLKSTFGKART